MKGNIHAKFLQLTAGIGKNSKTRGSNISGHLGGFVHDCNELVLAW